MVDLLVVLVVVMLLVAIYIGNELSHINVTLRECLNVLKEISSNTNEINSNTNDIRDNAEKPDEEYDT